MTSDNTLTAPLKLRGRSAFHQFAVLSVRWGRVPAGTILFFLAWYLLSLTLPDSRLVSPLRVVDEMLYNFVLSPHLQVFGLGRIGYAGLLIYSVKNVLLGLAVGAAIGLLLGLTSARFRPLRYLVDPITLVLGTVPVLVAAPLFLLWFGVVPYTQVLLVGLYSAVMMTIFSQRAVDNIDPVYELAAATRGANWSTRLRLILLPAVVPEVIGGLRVTLASAWGIETFTEILGAPSGIGQAIKTYTNVNNVAGMLACVGLVAIVAITMDFLLQVTARRISRWAH